MSKKTKIVIASVVVAALIGLYLYFRSEAQKKGWHKSSFWAALYGVEHYTEQQADEIAEEFEDIFEMGAF